MNAERPQSDATIRSRRTLRQVQALNVGEGALTHLLDAKLAPPRPPPGFVVRPRVSGMFEAAAACPLTVVSAGPGWGKTLAAAAWAASGPTAGKLAWVSLDEGDSDPRLFWSYVLAALRLSGVVPPENDLAELVPGPAVDEERFVAFCTGSASCLSPSYSCWMTSITSTTPMCCRVSRRSCVMSYRSAGWC